MLGRILLGCAVVVVIALAVLTGPAQSQREGWDSQRVRMVRQQIEARGVRDPRVLEAMRKVQRERFVPEPVRTYSASDTPLPIGFDQTISQPYIVAYMTELLELDRDHRVLEIGTGSGYQAAVLATLCDHVYSIEIVPELAERSAKILQELDYRNVSVRLGDGYLGWPEHAPFDRIILTAAPPELPEALVDQLAPQGRLVAPVGGNPDAQKIVLVTKDARGNVRRRNQLPVRFVPMVRGSDGR
ncbi:MAG: protein-L-isoaspartate(D-aspartate) O-methyltransferase [Acidobacteriia bacterium]|nr:protein-L-isoaspartate(D-aspartate) O-methyltransferase [Terriglobia bacterium]MYG04626.1 protein-L-isoaspartate(D-aspartate) O-methyltransferase [Terriglobia bacterium]MYK08729.1 protein-L-isoaspartate(D-aspartate) O-methyltransferase [Terriglobia bacterium]